MAGGLGQADGAGNDRSHDLFSQVAPEVLADLLTEAGPGVVHGQNNAEDGEGWVEASLFDSLDQIKDFSNPFESEVFALDGYENLFCSDEGAGHEKADAGRAVEDDEVECGIQPQGVEGLADVDERVFHPCEIHLRPRKVELGSENLQVGVARGLKHIGSPRLAEKDWVEAFSRSVLKTQPAGGVGLGIEVDQEDATARLGCSSGQMNGSGGLSHAPFLIHNGNDAHTQGKRCPPALSRGFPNGSLDLWDKVYKI